MYMCIHVYIYIYNIYCRSAAVGPRADNAGALYYSIIYIYIYIYTYIYTSGAGRVPTIRCLCIIV